MIGIPSDSFRTAERIGSSLFKNGQIEKEEHDGH
jgi:hypothetical protein